MEIKLFTPDVKEAWDSFVINNSDATCYHLSGWKNIFEKTYHHRTSYLYAIDKDHSGSVGIVGILPLALMKSLLFGSFLVSLPIFDHVGVCSESVEAKESLIQKAIEIAKEEKVSFIEFRQINPFPSNNGKIFDELILKSHKITMLLELPNSSEALWNSFKSKLRSQIRKPMKEGCEFLIGGLDQLDKFYEVFSTNMRDLGTPVNSKLLFKNILEEFPEDSKIAVVLKEKKPVAAGFIIGFKERLQIPWASSLRKFNSLSPNMLLYWGVLEYACKKGYRVFDFGRSSPEEGTHKFKEQWSPKTTPLYWHYWIANGGDKPELNPDNPKFKTFIKIWQNLPIPIANIIGPRIIKYLPQ
jgi:serine/alanine adding enzyme